MKHKSVALVLVGMVIGCGAAVVTPMVHSHAQAKGKWGCYVADRLPDVSDAADWDGASNIRKGMEQIAPNAPAGTMIAVTPKSGGGYASVICVKYQ